MKKLEKDVIKNIKAGDKEAFRDLLVLYEHRVYGFIKKMVYDTHVAEDLTQETFLAVYRSLDTYDESKPFATWLFTIAKHKAFKVIQKNSKLESCDLKDQEIVDETCDVLHQIIVEEEHLELLNKISQLKESNQEVLTLKYFSEMSYKEIAETLNISVKTVENRLTSAKKELSVLMKSKERLVNQYEY